MEERLDPQPPPPGRLFTAPRILLLVAGSAAVLLVLNRILRFLCLNLVRFDCPPYWPVSVFFPLPTSSRQLLFALALALAFSWAVSFLARNRYRLDAVLLVGFLLLVGSNLLHGTSIGLVYPIAGSGDHGVQYYHDAVKIDSAGQFLSDYVRLQPTLKVHSETHPPGAVLLFYALIQAGLSPALIALLLAGFSWFLSARFLNRILVREGHGEETRGYLTFLFVLLPAVGIYYLASLDALLAALLLGALDFFLDRKSGRSVLAAGLLTLAVSFLTFGFLFILPVMAGYEILTRRSLRRSALIMLLLELAYILLYLFTGFDYFKSFQVASAIENPWGFWLWVDPASYLSTRLEGILEILLFAGPGLVWLMIRGLRAGKSRDSLLLRLTWLALGTLLAIFLAGTFRTGETARACLFIYPFFMFPVADYLKRHGLATRDQNILLALTFMQTLSMQWVGFYFW